MQAKRFTRRQHLACSGLDVLNGLSEIDEAVLNPESNLITLLGELEASLVSRLLGTPVLGPGPTTVKQPPAGRQSRAVLNPVAEITHFDLAERRLIALPLCSGCRSGVDEAHTAAQLQATHWPDCCE